MKTRSQLFAAVSLVTLAACQDMATNPEPDAARGAIKGVPAPSAVSVRREFADDNGYVTYSVRVRNITASLSSFQGTVSFGPGSFELVSQRATVLPGTAFLANASEFADGRIRFAAYSQIAFETSVDGIEVMRFTVRPTGIYVPTFAGSLDVAASTNGASVLGGVGAYAISALPSDAACAGNSLWGDGNADNSVNITDAQQVARYSTGLAVGNWTAVATRGDVTGDGVVNIVDAQQIARYSVGFTAAPRVNTWIC